MCSLFPSELWYDRGISTKGTKSLCKLKHIKFFTEQGEAVMPVRALPKSRSISLDALFRAVSLS